MSDPFASPPRKLPSKEKYDHRPRGYVAAQLVGLFTGWPGARSSGGCGFGRPVVPGGVSVLAVLVPTRSSVVTGAASIASITATAESTRGVRWAFRSGELHCIVAA